MIFTEIQNGIVLQNLTYKEQDLIIDICKGKFPTENFLPRPCVRGGNGEIIKGYAKKGFFLKLQEEIFDMIDNIFRNDFECELGKAYSSTKDEVAEKIANIITVCISYLNAIGYDEKERSELFAKVNEKNEKRGYFKGAD